MNTVTLQAKTKDHDACSEGPQPIAAVMSDVLARYGLASALQPSERVAGYRTNYPVQRGTGRGVISLSVSRSPCLLV